jgi:uncharacterized phiE125 gp8 family phage protein
VRLKLATAPTSEPVTLTQVKAQLRITGTSEDTRLTELIAIARELVEAYTHRALITQTWEQYQDDWPNGSGFKLAKGVAQSPITSITYIDEDDASDTIDLATVDLAIWEDPYPRITLKDGQDWPTVTLRPHDGVIVKWVAGYGLAAAVPGPLKHAVTMAVVALYDGCPETIKEMPAVRALIGPYVIDLV